MSTSLEGGGSAGPVIFLDSGAGGIPYYRYFTERSPAMSAVYVADRESFPYGKKTKAGLARLLVNLVDRLSALFHPSLLVLACNTASVSALDELRACFPKLPFVGTVPAVRPAALASVTRRIGVLGTERTINDGYIDALTGSPDHPCAIIRLAAPSLVEFVEYRYLDAGMTERLDTARRWTELFRAEGVDGMVLGCTHFLFLLEEFRSCAAPDITVYDSIEGVCRRAGTLALAAKTSSGAVREFWVTGTAKLEDCWQRWAGTLGLKARLLSEAGMP